MQRGFPLALLELVRCSTDGGSLRVVSDGAGAFADDGDVACVRCGRLHHIRNGILSLLDGEPQHPESRGEMRARDVRNQAMLEGERAEWTSAFAEDLEVRPTLAAVDTAPDAVVCELGCGPGRYTLSLAQSSKAVVAVDFSRAGLMVLKAKLDDSASVALVQADVTRPYGAPRTFDRLLSTLHSNLPGRELRMASLQEVSTILKEDGRAVISMHHYSLRDALLGVPASGRYQDSGIYRHFMTTRESRKEVSPYFARLAHRHIAVSVPGVRSRFVGRTAAAIPLLRSGLGRLFLAIGEHPVRRHADRTALDNHGPVATSAAPTGREEVVAR